MFTRMNCKNRQVIVSYECTLYFYSQTGRGKYQVNLVNILNFILFWFCLFLLPLVWVCWSPYQWLRALLSSHQVSL